MKQKFQIQISKLKSYIKKLKLDLDKVSEDFRLSIDGIKSQSMMMSSQLIVQLETKKNQQNFSAV